MKLPRGNVDVSAGTGVRDGEPVPRRTDEELGFGDAAGPCPACGHDTDSRGPRDCRCCWIDVSGRDRRKPERRVPWRDEASA